ncbi:MAG: DUF1501 domain-containing protein [Acidobacteria bacterium]|nr:DUF1501 domain-containing protein [Acidobacteriota bacterium]
MSQRRCRCNGEHSRMVSFISGPGFSRRQFFRVAGTALTGYYFTRALRPIDVLAQSRVQTAETAKNCIFVFLSGAPSHVDLFDYKEDADVERPSSAGGQPLNLMPETYMGVRMSRRLLPSMSDLLGDISILRSVESRALAHPIAQVWTHIGRSPTGALGNVSPNIGSVVAFEMESRRKATDLLPGFVALNATGLTGAGYFSAKYSPFHVIPATGGLAELTHPDGQAQFDSMWSLIQDLDSPLRLDSPLGKSVEDMGEFYNSALKLMGSAEVKKAFQFTVAEVQRYEPPQGASSGGRYGSNSSFAGACLVARNLLAVNKGTRFITLTLPGWDMHSNIYSGAASLLSLAPTLDYGLAGLIKDLKNMPSPERPGKTLLDDTLIAVQGEFGRTPDVNDQGGRDHFLRQFCVLAGGGVAGGRVIGQTDKTGDKAVDFGWHANRSIRIEDVFATVYSALGIDYTTVRFDDPIGRGFEYVPMAADGIYEPVTEVFVPPPPPRRRRVI